MNRPSLKKPIEAPAVPERKQSIQESGAELEKLLREKDKNDNLELINTHFA